MLLGPGMSHPNVFVWVRVRGSWGVASEGNSVWVCALGARREIMKIGRGLGCGGEGVSELWLGQCSEIAKVTGRGWRVRIWGRGAAGRRGRRAVGGGFGVRRGCCMQGVGDFGCRVVQCDVRVIAQRLRGGAVVLRVLCGWWVGRGGKEAACRGVENGGVAGPRGGGASNGATRPWSATWLERQNHLARAKSADAPSPLRALAPRHAAVLALAAAHVLGRLLLGGEHAEAAEKLDAVRGGAELEDVVALARVAHGGDRAEAPLAVKADARRRVDEVEADGNARSVRGAARAAGEERRAARASWQPQLVARRGVAVRLACEGHQGDRE